MGTSVIEVLDESQEWSIPLPKEDDTLLDRVLEARDRENKVRAQWRYGGTQSGQGWLCVEGVEPNPNAPTIGVKSQLYDLFEEIVEGCIKYEWTLWSLPPVVGSQR